MSRSDRTMIGDALQRICLFVLLCLPLPGVAAERLVICHGSPASALVPLAQLQGYFAGEGLEVEIRKHPSGFQALEAMLAGQCSLATAAVPPVVHQSLRRNDFRILAAIAASEGWHKLIVRSDRGIRSAADLRGRRIAVAESTTAHYFLDMYLAAHGVTPAQTTQVYLPAQEVGPAFRRGEVDAAAHWEPNIQPLAREYGARAGVLTAPALEVNPFLLLGRLDYIQPHPAAIRSVLRALLRAERLVMEQPALARTRMAGYFGVEQQAFDAAWTRHDFHVTLDQPLLSALEGVTRWHIGRLPPAQRPTLPDYLDRIDLNPLQAVRPQAVTLIH